MEESCCCNGDLSQFHNGVQGEHLITPEDAVPSVLKKYERLSSSCEGAFVSNIFSFSLRYR